MGHQLIIFVGFSSGPLAPTCDVGSLLERADRKRWFGGGGVFVMGDEFAEADYASLGHCGGNVGRVEHESLRRRDAYVGEMVSEAPLLVI